jgi:hypothetical protein
VRYSNRRRAVQKLVSAWEHGVSGILEDDDEPNDPLIGVATEARRRTLTPLSLGEVAAIRTQRAAGVSVNALARQYGVTRQTIWAKTHTNASRGART